MSRFKPLEGTYAGIISHGSDESVSRYNGALDGFAVTHEHETYGDPDNYTQLAEFHPDLHIVLSDAFINFDLNVLSREQRSLIKEYLKTGDGITDEVIMQLDIFLGSILEDSDEFCTKRK